MKIRKGLVFVLLIFLMVFTSTLTISQADEFDEVPEVTIVPHHGTP